MLSGEPFEKGKPANALLEDFTKKVNEVKDMDAAAKKELIAKAKDALLTSVKPAYEKLLAYWNELGEKSYNG